MAGDRERVEGGEEECEWVCMWSGVCVYVLGVCAWGVCVCEWGGMCMCVCVWVCVGVWVCVKSGCV